MRMRLGVAGKLSSSTKDLCVAGRRELGNEWVGLGRSSDEMIGFGWQKGLSWPQPADINIWI